MDVLKQPKYLHDSTCCYTEVRPDHIPVSEKEHKQKQQLYNLLDNSVSTTDTNHQLNTATNDGDILLVWGCGEFGQHGHGHQNDIPLSTGLSNPLLIGQDGLVTMVACGSSHTVCITDDNRIYSWGNGNSGQLGIGQTKTLFQPHLVHLGVSLGTRVKGVACGTRHTFVWTEEGECYSFGNNFSAQLGYDFRKPDFKNNQPSPVYIETLFNQKILQVACGSRHSLFLFSSGSIASVGSNDRGQLGLDSKTASVYIQIIPDMQDIGIIGCGNCHCLAADGSGNLYVWGYGKACGSKDDILAPTSIYKYASKSIKTVVGGDSHSMLLLENGTLYSWGVNFEGQLGQGDCVKYQSNPTPIKGEALQGNVSSISVGENTSAAITDDGALYMWGRNVSQVFRDDNGPRHCQYDPYLVSLGIWKANKISCGSWHVACTVYSSTKNSVCLPSIESISKDDLSEILYKAEDSCLSKHVSDYDDGFSDASLVPIDISKPTDTAASDLANSGNKENFNPDSQKKLDIVKEDDANSGDQMAITLESLEEMNTDTPYSDGDCESKTNISTHSRAAFVKTEGNIKQTVPNTQSNTKDLNMKTQQKTQTKDEEDLWKERHNIVKRTQNVRTQREDSSACKSIYDLVPLKHGNIYHFSRSLCDIAADKYQEKNSSQGRRSSTGTIRSCSLQDNNSDIKHDFKSQEFQAEDETTIIINTCTRPIDCSHTATKLKVSGQLKRGKKPPLHLRKVPSSTIMEYNLPNQPLLTSDGTSHTETLQRTQSNPTINTSSLKFEYPSSLSTPTTPPSAKHVPHPPSLTTGLPPRHPGPRKSHSQLILYSSGSSWRKRSSNM